MAQDINLLPEQTDQDKKKKQQQRLINMISLAAIGVTVVAVAVVLGLNYYFQTQIDGVQKNIGTQDAIIQSHLEQEGVYRALNLKIQTLSTFFTNQKHYSNFLAQFTKTLPNSLKLTDMAIDNKNQVIISGKVASYADLAGFYDKLSQAGTTSGKQVQAFFTNPVITSITRNDQSGDITFGMQFTLAAPVLAATSTGAGS